MCVLWRHIRMRVCVRVLKYAQRTNETLRLFSLFLFRRWCDEQWASLPKFMLKKINKCVCLVYGVCRSRATRAVIDVDCAFFSSFFFLSCKRQISSSRRNRIRFIYFMYLFLEYFRQHFPSLYMPSALNCTQPHTHIYWFGYIHFSFVTCLLVVADLLGFGCCCCLFPMWNLHTLSHFRSSGWVLQLVGIIMKFVHFISGFIRMKNATEKNRRKKKQVLMIRPKAKVFSFFCVDANGSGESAEKRRTKNCIYSFRVPFKKLSTELRRQSAHTTHITLEVWSIIDVNCDLSLSHARTHIPRNDINCVVEELKSEVVASPRAHERTSTQLNTERKFNKTNWIWLRCLGDERAKRIKYATNATMS